jgi:hypothetical protein
VRPGRALAPVLALAALGLGACGYGFTQRWVSRSGAERVHVRAFENRSAEPELGAALTEALRTELARRGAAAPEGAPAVIEGEVRATEPVPTATREAGEVATWRIGIEVRARLVEGGATVAEKAIRREVDFLGGADPRESEGRRALALRRLAAGAAREILVAFER